MSIYIYHSRERATNYQVWGYNYMIELSTMYMTFVSIMSLCTQNT